MRYRIKIVRFKSGKIEYYTQLKKWWGWNHLDITLQYDSSSPKIYYTRESALQSIDDHYNNATNTQTIQFEYINKP